MTDQMTAAEAKDTVRAIRDQLDAFAGQLDRIDHSAARDVHRARDSLFTAWRTLHRIASDFQEGEQLRHYRGDRRSTATEAAAGRAWTDVKFVGPIQHDTRYARYDLTWAGSGGWADFADLDRAPAKA